MNEECWKLDGGKGKPNPVSGGKGESEMNSEQHTTNAEQHTTHDGLRIEHFEVIAGEYDDNERETFYSNSFDTYERAKKIYDTVINYPWAEIRAVDERGEFHYEWSKPNDE